MVIAMHKRESTGSECARVAAAALRWCWQVAPLHWPAPQFTPGRPLQPHRIRHRGDGFFFYSALPFWSGLAFSDRLNDAGVLTGSRDEQFDPKLYVTTRRADELR